MDVALDRGQHHGALGGAFDLLHVGLQTGDGEFHRLGGLQDFGYNQLIGVELPAHFSHAGHQGAVDYFQGLSVGQGFIQVFGQPLFGALDDCQGQPFVHGRSCRSSGGALAGRCRKWAAKAATGSAPRSHIRSSASFRSSCGMEVYRCINSALTIAMSSPA